MSSPNTSPPKPKPSQIVRNTQLPANQPPITQFLQQTSPTKIPTPSPSTPSQIPQLQQTTVTPAVLYQSAPSSPSSITRSSATPSSATPSSVTTPVQPVMVSSNEARMIIAQTNQVLLTPQPIFRTPPDKTYTPDRFIGLKLDNLHSLSAFTTSTYKQQLFKIINDSINKINSVPRSDLYSDVIRDLQNIINVMSDPRSLQSNVYKRYNTAIKKYDKIYNDLITSGEYTYDVNRIVPSYAGESSDLLIQTYNDFVVTRVANRLPIYESMIPKNLISELPENYINLLSAYNQQIQFQQIGSKFKVDGLLLKITTPQVKTEKVNLTPTGFTEIAVNTFFKRLESNLQNNYSDFMGEYKVGGSDTPIRLYMDKNYNFVVVQGRDRRVFKDPHEARKFCLLGGFDSDAVQRFRASSNIINVLAETFRAIPRIRV